MKLFSLTAILGVACVAFMSAGQSEARNPLTAGVLQNVHSMELQISTLKSSFDLYLAGDCSQTDRAYTALADLIRTIEGTMAAIKQSGRGLEGEDVAKIGKVLEYTGSTIHYIVDALINNYERVVESDAAWIVSKAVPYVRAEYNALRDVLLNATPAKRRDQIEGPITYIIQEISRVLDYYANAQCACYENDQIAGLHIGLELIISVSISINLRRRELEPLSLAPLKVRTISADKL